MAKAKKQVELPGIEKPTIQELDVALEEYFEKASELSKARVTLGEMKVKIIALAEKHGVTLYRNETTSPPLVLSIQTGATKVKVRASGVDIEDDEESDE